MFAPTRFKRRLTPVLLLILIAALMAGCGIFSPDESKNNDGGDPPPTDFGAATSPDKLMENFKNAWEQRSLVEYQKLLDDQFQFFFDPNDGLDQYVGPSWGYTEELDSAKSIFQGDSGFDYIKQETIPPVLSIQFTTFAKIIDWENPPTDPLYEGTLRARYKVGISVSFQGVEQTTLVTGDNDFYVIKVPQTDGPDIYKIKVWEDQGQNLGT
jgi:hypothetical protein